MQRHLLVIRALDFPFQACQNPLYWPRQTKSGDILDGDGRLILIILLSFPEDTSCLPGTIKGTTYKKAPPTVKERSSPSV